jgi:sugar lactone lactonase YvrE
VWQPDLQAVVIGGQRIYAYEVNTGKLTSWARPDGFVNGAGVYVPPATMFYDPDTRDVMSIGGIDWDTSMYSPVYWRLKITP